MFDYTCIDCGTTIVKPLHAEMFAAGINENVSDGAKNVMTVEGRSYMMDLFNEKSYYDTNSNKTLNKNIRLNFQFALHKSTYDDVGRFKNVVVSLPAKQWEKNSVVEKYKELLSLRNPVTIDVNGVKREISVDEINVVPEDMPAYYAKQTNSKRFNGNRVLLIGIGSFNSNQFLFDDDEYIDLESNEKGCLKVFQKMASEINAEFNINIKTEEMYKILTKGLFIEGEKIQIEPIINEIGNDFAKEFYKELKLRWAIKTIPYIELLGGGSMMLSKYLKEYMPHSELLPEAQTIAVQGMEEMLRMC